MRSVGKSDMIFEILHLCIVTQKTLKIISSCSFDNEYGFFSKPLHCCRMISVHTTHLLLTRWRSAGCPHGSVLFSYTFPLWDYHLLCCKHKSIYVYQYLQESSKEQYYKSFPDLMPIKSGDWMDRLKVNFTFAQENPEKDLSLISSNLVFSCLILKHVILYQISSLLVLSSRWRIWAHS